MLEGLLTSIKSESVMDRKTARAVRRLNSNLIFWGSWLRRKGAEALAGTHEPDAVAPLAGALNDRREMVRHAVRMSLTTLSGKAVDSFCRHWAKNREDSLKKIIQEAGYTVQEDVLLHTLTCFLNGKKPGKVSEEVLTACLIDREEEIVSGSIAFFLEDLKSRSEEQLWAFALEHPESLVCKCLNKRDWHPGALSERALFYFLSGDLEKYHDIDIEQKHLRYWYETSEPKLKEAIAAGIRQSGQKRLLAVFRTERGGRKEKLSEAEVDLQIDILTQKQDFAALFGLLAFATHAQGGRIIAAMQQAGWQNSESRSRELQERIEKLVKAQEERRGPSSFAMKIYQDFRPMFMGSEKPPEDVSGLSAWLADAGNFRHRSAALIVMAESKASGLEEAANKACGDAYWQVRMAAAGCELLHPGTLSPANKALLEGDHVYWVQALLRMPPAGRLVDLGPAGLEKLKQRGKKSDPKVKPEGPDDFFVLLRGLVPDPEAEYLLTLGEFLGTDIAVSEEAAYEAGEADIEIEMGD
jgi:hypothetical protein